VPVGEDQVAHLELASGGAPLQQRVRRGTDVLVEPKPL
jgi:tryptophanyl-tRNA synthetase